MEWMKYTINTTEEAEDLVCSMLNDFGIMNVEIEDKAPVSPDENGGYFGDVVPDLGGLEVPRLIFQPPLRRTGPTTGSSISTSSWSMTS